MTKVLVLYYSSYGHIEKMAESAADGAREAGAEVASSACRSSCRRGGAQVSISSSTRKRLSRRSMSLPDYDAIIIGVPTRFGNMPAQMKNFLDQTGGLWFGGKLIGKVGSVFSSTCQQHGGQESTILSTHTVLLHQGMVIVGLPYSFQGQMGVKRSDRRLALRRRPRSRTVTVPGSLRQTSLLVRTFQGRHVAQIAAAKLRA